MVLMITAAGASSLLVDITRAMVIVWRIRGKIIRTVLCRIEYDSYTQWYAHTYEMFLKMSVGLGLGLVFVRLFRLSMLCVLWFSYFVFVLFAFVVLGLFYLVLGYTERLAGKNVSGMTYSVSSGT